MLNFKKVEISDAPIIQEITQNGEDIAIALTADGFLYNMARILVGTLIEIGLGQRRIDTIEEIFASKQRENAGETAPAKGLFLTEVRYEHSDFR